MKPPPLRHFHRSFVIIPQGNGYVIVNDSLFITNTTAIQNKTAFVEENASNVMMSTISPVDAQNMVAELIKLTNLRADWARRSLEENKLDDKNMSASSAQICITLIPFCLR